MFQRTFFAWAKRLPERLTIRTRFLRVRTLLCSLVVIAAMGLSSESSAAEAARGETQQAAACVVIDDFEGPDVSEWEASSWFWADDKGHRSDEELVRISLNRDAARIKSGKGSLKVTMAQGRRKGSYCRLVRVPVRLPESVSSNHQKPAIRPYDGPPRPSKQEDSGEPTASEGHRTIKTNSTTNFGTRFRFDSTRFCDYTQGTAQAFVYRPGVTDRKQP